MEVLSKVSTSGLRGVMAGGIVALEPINDVTSIGLAGLLHLVTTPVGLNPPARATYFAEGIRYGIDTTAALAVTLGKGSFTDESGGARQSPGERTRGHAPPGGCPSGGTGKQRGG